jgi:hypothetical protein
MELGQGSTGPRPRWTRNRSPAGDHASAQYPPRGGVLLEGGAVRRARSEPRPRLPGRLKPEVEHGLDRREGDPPAVRRVAGRRDGAVGEESPPRVGTERAIPEHTHAPAARVDVPDTRRRGTRPEGTLALPPIDDLPVPAGKRPPSQAGSQAQDHRHGEQNPASNQRLLQCHANSASHDELCHRRVAPHSSHGLSSALESIITTAASVGDH